jgi:hypothetical protein
VSQRKPYREILPNQKTSHAERCGGETASSRKGLPRQQKQSQQQRDGH